MKSIRRGLWDGEVEKDARGRFACRVCGQSLEAETPTTEEGADTPVTEEETDTPTTEEGTDPGRTVRTCPDCGRAWES